MRSLIILEVEHDETTDGLQMFTEYCNNPEIYRVRVLNYTVRVDLPECFRLES